MPGSHAIVSPSGYAQWMMCPGSAQAKALIKESPQSPAAREGTEAHSAFEAALRQYHKFRTYSLPERFAILEEGVEYVISLKGEKRIEYRVNIYPALGFEDPYIWGTADVIVLQDRKFHVIDLKYGKHFVPADTPQLELYALGIADSLEWEFDECVTTIVQPRASGKSIRSRGLTKEQLILKIGLYRKAVKRAMAKNPSRNPGDTQCYFCDARSSCPEYHDFKVARIFEDLDGI